MNRLHTCTDSGAVIRLSAGEVVGTADPAGITEGADLYGPAALARLRAEALQALAEEVAA